MCMQVLSESTQWFFGGQTIHKEWIIATFYVNVDEELELSFCTPIKPSTTQQQRLDYMNAEFIMNHGRVQQKFHQ